MPSTAEERFRPDAFDFRVTGAAPGEATARRVAAAARDYIARLRPGLAQVVQVEAEGGAVVLRASGEWPGDVLAEARDLLGLREPDEAEDELEVDAAEFAVEAVSYVSEEAEAEGELLHSKVRCFPHPVAEWFEISSGDLFLTDRAVIYEPEWQLMQDDSARNDNRRVTPLEEIEQVYRGEWLGVPCLMIQTPGITYRYGWPSERGELELIFNVDEWIERLRSLREE
jgi:hypothetical protein